MNNQFVGVTVPLGCPDCRAPLKNGPFFLEATTQIKRKCKKCRQRWSVILRPKRVERGGVRKATITTADFTRETTTTTTTKETR